MIFSRWLHKSGRLVKYCNSTIHSRIGWRENSNRKPLYFGEKELKHLRGSHSFFDLNQPIRCMPFLEFINTRICIYAKICYILFWHVPKDMFIAIIILMRVMHCWGWMNLAFTCSSPSGRHWRNNDRLMYSSRIPSSNETWQYEIVNRI